MSHIDSDILAATKATRKRMTLWGAIAGAIVLTVTLVLFVRQDPPTTAPASSEGVSRDIATISVDRDALQMAFAEVLRALDAVSADTAMAQWQPPRLQRIRDEFALAQQQYASSDFASLPTMLEALGQDILSYQREYALAFTQAHQQALSQFEQDNVIEAQRLNRQALDIKPDYPPAVALAQRIAVYDQVQIALDKARIAAIEGRPTVQREALQAALALDPERQAIANDLAVLEQQLAKDKFTRLYAQAVSALDTGDVAGATALLNTLEQLDKSNASLALLRNRIQQQDDERRRQRAEQAALQQRLTAAEDRINRFLQRPARLRDVSIELAAKQALEDVSPLLAQSERLTVLSQQLSQALIDQTRPVTVTLKSDNRTFVRLRGQGILGEFKQRDISLKPGEYRFEGKREGYRDEVITLQVEPGKDGLTVTLVCQQKV